MQNTKNEQQKDLCITSEQLTDKWKKGELIEGYYYCKTENGDEILRTWRGIDSSYLNFENMCNEVFISSMDDCEVIAPVPSYDELQNMNKAVNECMAANIKLVEENKQLKELLEEIRDSIAESQLKLTPEGFKLITEIVAKIDEALQ